MNFKNYEKFIEDNKKELIPYTELGKKLCFLGSYINKKAENNKNNMEFLCDTGFKYIEEILQIYYKEYDITLDENIVPFLTIIHNCLSDNPNCDKITLSQLRELIDFIKDK